jgi:enoyl-CoA hydratase/carnithine racemase
VLGPVRGRYFLATQQRLGAREAQTLGVVNEVLPAGELMPRARALAAQLAALPTLTLRYMRVATSQPIKELLTKNLSHGLALQGLSGAARGNPGPDPRPEDAPLAGLGSGNR